MRTPDHIKLRYIMLNHFEKRWTSGQSYRDLVGTSIMTMPGLMLKEGLLRPLKRSAGHCSRILHTLQMLQRPISTSIAQSLTGCKMRCSTTSMSWSHQSRVGSPPRPASSSLVESTCCRKNGRQSLKREANIFQINRFL